MLLDDFTERVDTDVSNDAGMLGLPGPPRTLRACIATATASPRCRARRAPTAAYAAGDAGGAALSC